MPNGSAPTARERPVEYFILMEPRPDGPAVGYLDGRPIAAAVVDFFGAHYAYVGAAPRRPDGRYDVEALKAGEWLVEPGLVYYADPKTSTGLISKLLRSH